MPACVVSTPYETGKAGAPSGRFANLRLCLPFPKCTPWFEAAS